MTLELQNDLPATTGIVWEGRFLRIELIDSPYGLYEVLTAESTHGVASIVVHRNKVLLVKQFRPPVNKHLWEFPGGACDELDNPESKVLDAARELAEETGVVVPTEYFQKLGKLNQLPGSANSEVTYFVVKLPDEMEQPIAFPQPGEIDEVAWMDIDEIINHEDEDFFSVALLLHAAKHKGLI
jgi:ADP-ribose pyrophosphatase